MLRTVLVSMRVYTFCEFSTAQWKVSEDTLCTFNVPGTHYNKINPKEKEKERITRENKEVEKQV